MGSPIPLEHSSPAEMKFCVDCGHKILRRAEICPHCGCRQVAAPGVRQVASPKMAPFMSIGFTSMGLIAAAGIIFFLIASWIIDSIAAAMSDYGLALGPFLKFCVIFLLGIKGVVRETRRRP
jgi:hypothetical protein